MSVRGSGVKLRQRHRSPVLLHMAGIHHAIAPAVPEGPGAVVTASEIGATRFVTLDHLDRVEGIERPEIRHRKSDAACAAEPPQYCIRQSWRWPETEQQWSFARIG